jgi:uncharacterized phage protein gp47/JayE
MFEQETKETILRRMLDRVSAARDKREGSIIYDATAPAAIEFELLYAFLDWYLVQSFGDTAEREYLIKLALERGLSPEEATYAVVKGQFTPSTLELNIGERFSLGTINYAITEKVSAGIYLLRCESAGTIGNQIVGQLLPINYIEGLETASLVEVTIPGENEEGTEVFRERYLKSFDNLAFGGNIADYKEKVLKIDGVGGVKVYPIWQGGGTVRIAFMTSDFNPPTTEFIAEVQEAVDPIPYHQQGVGTAPIGHYVTVAGASDSSISIDLTITYAEGYSFDDLSEQIEGVIDAYFLELNKNWANNQIVTTEQFSNSGIVVRISQIESRLLEISEIVDIQDTTLNGIAANLTLSTDELAVRGAVSG